MITKLHLLIFACFLLRIDIAAAQPLPVEAAMRERRVDILLTPDAHDLRLSISQKQEIAQHMSDYLERRNAFRRTIDDNDPDRFKLRGEWDEIASRKLTEEICEKVLLPIQVERLTELVLQQRLREGGVAAVLKSRDVSTRVADMKVPEHVVEDIKKRTTRAYKEFDKALAELVKRFKEDKKLLEKKRDEEIIAPLSDPQRQMLDKLLGDPIRETDATRDRIDNVN